MLHLAPGFRPRLLRHRNDVHGRFPLRPRPLRRRSFSSLAPPGRSHDRCRTPLPENGTRHSPALRSNARTQVGHLHGSLRHFRRRLQQLRHRAGLQSDHPRGRLRPRLSSAPRSRPLRHSPAPEKNRRRKGLLQTRPESLLSFLGVRQLAAAFTQSAHPAKSAAEGAPGTECVPGSWVALLRRVPQYRFCTWVLGCSSPPGAPVPVLYLGLGLLFSAGCPRYRFCTWVLGSAWVASCARGGPAKNLFFPSTSW